METIDAIRSRRQVRAFTSEPIDADVLRTILESASRAPSARNFQRWDFVVDLDADKKAGLAQTWQGASWMADAAAVVALVVPTGTPEEAAGVRFDLGQAAMLIMLSAADQGVGAGQASCRDQDLARSVLGLPDDREVAMLIALGSPADRPLAPIVKHDRKAFDEVVHFDTW